MKIYCVMHYIPYEGNTLEKIFTTKEKAIKFMLQHDGRARYKYVPEEHLVENNYGCCYYIEEQDCE